jgi:glutamate racemase
VQLVDTGAPVARQTRRILAQAGTLAPEPASAHPDALAGPAQIQLMTTGQLGALQSAPCAGWTCRPTAAARSMCRCMRSLPTR